MTDAELTILSVLAHGPRYGHEIHEIIDERGLREWLLIGFSSIYYILNKFERQNMVSSELRTEHKGPARKLYRLTDAGRGVLQTAIAELLRAPRALGTGFELGLANLHALTPSQVYQVLSHHRDDLRQQYDYIQQSWQRHQAEDAPPTQDHIHALYTHSLAMMQADLAWLDDFLATWRERYPGVERSAQLQQGTDEDITLLSRRTSPDPLKMIQRLQRPPQPSDNDENDEG